MALVILLLRTGGNPRTAFTSLTKALKDGAELSGMIYALLIGASIFTLFMTMAKVPQGLSSFVTGLPIPPTLTVLLVLLTLIPLGMFLDGFSILLVMVPLIHPIVVTDLGFDGGDGRVVDDLGAPVAAGASAVAGESADSPDASGK